MSELRFVRPAAVLRVVTASGEPLAFVAANNVDSHSLGHWPSGEFALDRHQTHADDSPDSAYGSYGIFVFDVPGRTGMGVHSGREHVKDGLGREGYLHATMGCIRTTDDAMSQLVQLHVDDPIARIVVVDA